MPIASSPTFERAEMRFATFLAEHRRWYDDSDLQPWLRLLDDYVSYSTEREDFAEFLKNGEFLGGREHNKRFLESLSSRPHLMSLIIAAT